MSTFEQEIAGGSRFGFGRNWADYVPLIDEARIEQAVDSIKSYLGVATLEGKRLLDIGSGSGVFSLAAARLGATVLSFDFDPNSVSCAREVKRRFLPDCARWTIHEGSVLDRTWLESLGTFDVVYSWGVLHHTGEMWSAVENASRCVAPGGFLFIAIYNDQGAPSRRWLAMKQAYNRLPPSLRFLVLGPATVRLWGPTVAKDLLHGRPFHSLRTLNRERGMTPWVGVVDWVGGLPFEVAKPEEILDFLRPRRFVLEKLRTCAGGLGCNEFVFRLEAAG